MKAQVATPIPQQRDTQITVDSAMDERFAGKVLFQHKIDRIYELFANKQVKENLKKQARISGKN